MLIGSLAKAGYQWVVLLILVRTMGPSSVGKYGLAMGFVLPIKMFSSLQLNRLQATDSNHSFAFSDYMGLRLCTTVLAFGAILAGSLYFLSDIETRWIALALTFQLAALGILEVYFGLYSQSHRVDLIGKANTLVSVSMLVLTSVLLLAGMNMALALFLGSSTIVAVAILFVLPMGRVLLDRIPGEGGNSRPRFKTDVQRRLIRIALPIGIVVLLVSLTSNVPRYFLAAFSDSFHLGIFVALMSLLSAGTLFTDSLGQTASPKISWLHAQGRKSETCDFLISTTRNGVLFSIAIMICTWFAGPFVVEKIYGPAYSSNRFVLLCVAAIFSFQLISRFIDIFLTSARIVDLNAISAGVSLLAVCLLSWWLVPIYGISGAAFSLVAAALLRFALLGVLTIRYILGWREHDTNQSPSGVNGWVPPKLQA